jgi:multidrug efflux pump subunit AcrB
MASGFVRLNYLDSIEGDFVAAELVFPPGTPEVATRTAIDQIEDALAAVRSELDQRHGEGTGNDITHVMATVGSQPFKSDSRAESPSDMTPSAGGGHVGEVMIELLPTDQRRSGADEIARLWREAVGPIPGAIELTYSSALVSSGELITIQLKSADLHELGQAADELKAELSRFPGVHDISDTHRGGKQELQLSLRDSAEPLGLSISYLARQVRQAFYGEEVQKVQRDRDEVKVMVRYPRDQRRSLADLEDMRIRTPDGQEVPFNVVAEVMQTSGATSIQRSNRKRAIGITANADTSMTTANEVVESLMDGAIPEILAHYPTVSFATTGQQKAQKRAFSALGKSFVIALLVVFSLLAIPLKSFYQPLIIMSVIPFALVGVVIGHVVMGYGITFMSFAGFITLSGIVVNSSLVLVVAINSAREKGASLEQAVITAGLTRFRPIILTSFTTFVGLAPLIFNRTFEAQFLVPVAITVAFGVMFATLLSLVAVPCVYLIADDLSRRFGVANIQTAFPAAAFDPPADAEIVQKPLPKGVVLDRGDPSGIESGATLKTTIQPTSS